MSQPQLLLIWEDSLMRIHSGTIQYSQIRNSWIISRQWEHLMIRVTIHNNLSIIMASSIIQQGIWITVCRQVHTLTILIRRNQIHLMIACKIRLTHYQISIIVHRVRLRLINRIKTLMVEELTFLIILHRIALQLWVM